MIKYKESKTLDNQIKYLHDDKRIQFNVIDEKNAKNILFKYNYINVISPYKHHFAKTNNKHEVIKINNRHIYERDVEFDEYYQKYKAERKQYPLIIKNILGFETIFKSIVSYRLLINYEIKCSDDLVSFLDKIFLNLSMNYIGRYKIERVEHMKEHIDYLKDSVDKYHDVYCFFDRMSLGHILTIYSCLDDNIQNIIFNDCKAIDMVFNVDKTPDFINKIFTLVSIRNCVMHCNSLEILIRFFDPKEKKLRDSTNKKKFTKMIDYLNKEKDYTKMV